MSTMTIITVVQEQVPDDAREHLLLDNYDAPLAEVFAAAREFQDMPDDVAAEAFATRVHKVYITEGQHKGYAIKALVSGYDADAAAVAAEARWEELQWEDATGR